MDLQGWKKTYGVGCGDLNDKIILTIWFQTIIHTVLVSYLNSFYSWNSWLVLITIVISISHPGHQARLSNCHDLWMVGICLNKAFSLTLVCMLIHLPILIPHLIARTWHLKTTSDLVGTCHLTDILGTNI